MIWCKPSVAELSLIGDEDTRSQSASMEVGSERITHKLAYSIVVLIVPAILVAHVHKNRQLYLNDVSKFERIMDGRDNTGENRLAQYGSAIRLYFFYSGQIDCSESDSDCTNLKHRIADSQNNRGLFLVKTSYLFLLFYLVFSFYGRVVEIHYKNKPKDPSSLGLQSDVIKQCSQILSLSAAFLFALIAAGVNFASLGVFGGLIGAGLSVALRDLLANVIAGVLLLWDRTIKKDDVITVLPSSSSDTGSTYAIVQRMTMRYTIVQDRNDVRRLIPNSLLTNNIVENWTHEENMVRLRVLIGVDYDTDLRLVRTILEAVCYEIPRIDTKKNPPKAVVLGFGDYSINFALRFWISDPNKGIRPVLSDLYIAIYERLKEEGIKIPYPRQELQILRPKKDVNIAERFLRETPLAEVQG
jgi:small-conductance mechanosensitive channel